MFQAESNPTSHSRLLTEKEVSHLFCVSLGFLRKQRLLNNGPKYIKVGRMVRYRLTDVDQFFDTHAVAPTVEKDSSSALEGSDVAGSQ
jgi:hypothetical protein